MNGSRFIALILGSALLPLPAHGPILADHVPAPVVSAGEVTTTTGSLLNVGQSFAGNARRKQVQK